VSEEEKIQQGLSEKFPFLKDKIRIQRPRRMYAEVSRENFFDVFDYAVIELGFPMLSAITGLDEGENLSFIYHLATESGVILNLKTAVAKEKPVLNTVTGYFFGAEIYERELVDLLGVKVEGLKKGKRYPLPDDWPDGQYPLRKDWKKEMLKGQEADKNG